MKEADELFIENPLKAIWIRLGVIEASVKSFNEALENNDIDGEVGYD